MSKNGNKTKRSFSAFYLAIFSGILLAILIINGLLEISRTRKGFYLLVEREAVVLIQHFERNIQEALHSLQGMENVPERYPLNPPLSGFFFGLEESVAEHLVEAAHRVDRMDSEKKLSEADAVSLIEQYSISEIEFYNGKGNLLRKWPSQSPAVGKKEFIRELVEKKRSMVIDLFSKPLSEEHWFSVAIIRNGDSGIIALHLHGEQMRRLIRQFAIQRAISDISLREGILFVSVQDTHFNILAHTDSSRVGKKEEDTFLKNALQRNQILFRFYGSPGKEKIYEVVKPFSFMDQPMGLIRIGYSSKEIDFLLHQIRKNVALSVFFFLILGIFAITLIGVNQNRHLRRIKEMEDRIQLAERLSSLGHLAAGVAHEIRNPLNAIGMGLQRLRKEFLPREESSKEEYLSFIGVVLKEIARVNTIIEQFLTLSRPSQVNLKPASLKGLLDHLVTLLQEEAASQHIQFQTEISPDLPDINMDEEKLTQAFINIMKNGMQAMEQAPIEQAEEQERTLRVSARAFKDRVEVTIADSGQGIPPDRMEKIFDYYYTTKEKGVGLGLPMAHRTIEAHGGRIKVESQAGTGTKVIVTLPL